MDDATFEEYKSLISYLVRRNVPKYMFNEDMLSIGYIAFVEAHQSFDEEKGKFNNWLGVKIREKLQQHMAAELGLTDHHHKLLRKKRRLVYIFETAIGRPASRTESSLIIMRNDVVEPQYMSIEDMPIASTEEEDDEEDTSLPLSSFDDMLTCLSASEKQVITHRILHNKTVKDTASIMGVTPGRIYQIEAKALKKLRRSDTIRSVMAGIRLTGEKDD